MKIDHAQESEVKLTEVYTSIPMLPQAFRMQTPKNLPTTLEEMFNLEPCGDYCQWLTGEA
jgi:hypothetical protein